MQVYIQGTKKGINNKIKAGDNCACDFVEYKLMMIMHYGFSSLPQGTVVKFWTKQDPSGTPIAKSYGQVKGGKII